MTPETEKRGKALLKAAKSLLESFDMAVGSESPLNEFQKDVVRSFFVTIKRDRAIINKAEGR